MRGWKRFLVVVALGSGALWSAVPTFAQESGSPVPSDSPPSITPMPPSDALTAPAPERQTLLFLIPGLSYEEMMAVPTFQALARSGGAALLSVRTAPGDEGTGAYLTLGAGARSSGPPFPVNAIWEQYPCDAEPAGCLETNTPARDVSLEMDEIRAHNGDISSPGALAEAIRAASGSDGAPTHYLGYGGTRQLSSGFLVSMDDRGNGSGGVLPRFTAPLIVAENPLLTLRQGDGRARVPSRRIRVLQAASFVERYTGQLAASQVQVIVLSPTTSPDMDARGDALPGIVMAEGSPEEIFAPAGEMGTLTSTTTRRDGLVSNEDIAPTILEYLDAPIPSQMKGAVIQVVDGPPPDDLHARHIAARQRRTPIAAAAAVGAMLAMVGIWWCSRRAARGSTAAATVGAWLTLSLITLPMALLAVGTLAAAPIPILVTAICLISFGVPAIAMRFRARGRFLPPAIVGGVILAFYLADAVVGSPSQLTTFLGSQGFDGGRYFGIHNVSLGLIVGASLFIAGAVRLRWGIVVLIGATLLIGAPWLGADNGGSVTLAFATGMWIVLRGSWRRVGWIDALVIAGVTVAGTGLVLVLDVLSPQPTHGARFVEVTGGSGIGAIAEVFIDRLTIGLRLLAENPTGVVYLVLLPVLLVAIMRPRPGLRAVIEPIPAWRAAIATMLVSSVVAFIANDTGVAASGLGVASAVVALVYASLTRDGGSPLSTRVDPQGAAADEDGKMASV